MNDLPKIEVFAELEQGSPEWLQARAGIMTASNAGVLLVDGKRKDGLGAGAVTYAYELAGEILTGKPVEVFSTKHTERGHEREPVLRSEYEFLTGNAVTEVGFVRRGRFGYSPDGLVANGRRIIEIKDRVPKIALPVMAGGALSKDEIAQAQFGMMIMGAEGCDFIVGSEGLPTMIRPLDPDPDIHAKFRERGEALLSLVDEVIAKIRDQAA